MNIHLEFTYDEPIDKVWHALTDAETLGSWLMPNDIVPIAGRSFQFRQPDARGWSGIVDCTVTAVEPPHRLAYTWVSGETRTEVAWHLERLAGKTRLTLDHTGFRGMSALFHVLMLGAGWKKMLRGKFRESVGAAA